MDHITNLMCEQKCAEIMKHRLCKHILYIYNKLVSTLEYPLLKIQNTVIFADSRMALEVLESETYREEINKLLITSGHYLRTSGLLCSGYQVTQTYWIIQTGKKREDQVEVKLQQL